MNIDGLVFVGVGLFIMIALMWKYSFHPLAAFPIAVIGECVAACLWAWVEFGDPRWWK